MAYGTSEGVYFADLRNPAHEPEKMLTLPDIGQIAVDTDRNMLAVLTGSLGSCRTPSDV
jgi:hypothetical protein